MSDETILLYLFTGMAEWFMSFMQRNMKKLMLLCLLISTKSYSQNIDFKIISADLKNELSVAQSYQNNPPEGYAESVISPDSLVFCVIQTDLNTQISPKEVSIVTTNKKVYYPVGSVNENNQADLPFTGIENTEWTNLSPIFLIHKDEIPVSLIYKEINKKIKLEKSANQYTINKIPKVEIVDVKITDEISHDYSLYPANVSFGSRNALKGVHKSYKPVNGKILLLRTKITSPEHNKDYETEFTKFSLYNDNGFVGNAIGYFNGFGYNNFGTLRFSAESVDPEEYELVFLVPQMQTKLSLRFCNISVGNFNIDHK
jgi:hypothetical protein